MQIDEIIKWLEEAVDWYMQNNVLSAEQEATIREFAAFAAEAALDRENDEKGISLARRAAYHNRIDAIADRKQLALGDDTRS